MLEQRHPTQADKLPTGVTGLDEILGGGLIPNHSYLLRGGPGTGKTTTALHFLQQGCRRDESVSFISLHEPPENIQKNAERFGFVLENIHYLDLSPSADLLSKNESYTIFSAAEVEGEDTTKRILEHIEEFQPSRLVIDSLSHLRYLSERPFHFRRQVIALQKCLRQKGITVLFLSECIEHSNEDMDIQHLVDGIIHLKSTARTRYIRVSKYRGSGFRGGYHPMSITQKGIEVYRRLEPKAHLKQFDYGMMSSGIPSLDELLHGGIERGTISIISGPTGVGKTTLGVQFMKEAAGRGENSAIYTFEEHPEILLRRCEAMNIPVRTMIKNGNLSLSRIEPLDVYADQFAQRVRRDIEDKNVKIVMIDSIAGYQLSLLGEDEAMSATEHLHALCKYLQNVGVTVILINELEHVIGRFKATSLGVSYLADNIVFLQYTEIRGQLERAIGILKKRLSSFEHSIHSFELTRYGLKVGEEITHIQGILSGAAEIIEPS